MASEPGGATAGSAASGASAAAAASGSGTWAGAGAGAGSTVRIGLAERERLLAALRECARAVEAVGREAAGRPRGRPLSPAVAQERSALLASLAHAVGLVEAAPVVLAAASPRGEDVSAALQGVGGGVGGCRPKERSGGGDLRRSKTPAPTSAGATSATARTKSTGDVSAAAGAGPGAPGRLRAGGGRDAPSPRLRRSRRREVTPPAPSAPEPPARPFIKIAIKGSYLESGPSGAGTDDSGEESTDRDEKDDDAAGDRKSTDRGGGGGGGTDADSSEQERLNEQTRSSASSASSTSGTLTRSSSGSSTSFAENWTSENTSPSRPCVGYSKGREVKKSVSFYLGAGEKRGTDSPGKRKGGNDNTLKKTGRPNLMSLVTKLSREEQRLSKLSREKVSTSLSALVQEMSDDRTQKLKTGMSRKLANAELEKKPGSRGSRGRRERPMDAIIVRKKKVGHENLSLGLKKIKANVSVTTKKSNTNIGKQNEQSRIYMRRTVSNLEPSNSSANKSVKSSKPKSGILLKLNNRTLETNKGDTRSSYETKRVSSALGNTGIRTNKTLQGNSTPRI